jgi:diguanylate cyclase (GGDEF)-like protein
MVCISAERLLKTGAFLSQMVQWGDQARKRAITDAATGLFNRRYLEDSMQDIVERARRDGSPLCFAMFDLDRFGKLNKAYGAEFCDRLILDAAAAILVRYGGDEFCFLLPATGLEAALKRSQALCQALRSLRFPEHPELRVSCSIGVAALGPTGGATELRADADKALYMAKEAGRDRALALGDARAELSKREMATIAQKNRVIANIVRALEERDSFLIIGHQNPDEDCIAAMVSFGLLASKLNKKAAIAVGAGIPENFRFLLNICLYNSIIVIEGDIPPPPGFSTLVIMDTAKPEMIDRYPAYAPLLADSGILKLEIDHHLESDAIYSGDPGYRLVTEASSSCELVGLLAFKMERDRALMERHQLTELFTRNIVLSILCGIIGDSRMGKYLKTRRERWFYGWFSSMFERMLAQKTRSGSGNFSSKEQVFDALATLSRSEAECFAFIASKEAFSGRVKLAALDPSESAKMFTDYGMETAVAVSKAVVDRFAESSGYLGMVAYYDDPANSDFVQFRLRRSQSFTDLDLRAAIAELGILNGGGHPGAVGFRIPKSDVPDIHGLALTFARRLDNMIGGS